MKIGIMQPYFFPYIGYWQLMNAVDEYLIIDNVNYIKSGYINRNRILVNGNPIYFGIPIKKASQNRLICEHEHDLDEKKIDKLLTTINSAYAKAPYFQSTYEHIKEILEFGITPEGLNLADFLENAIKKTATKLGIDTPIMRSSQEVKLDGSYRREHLVIAYCKKRNADEYYNAIGGTKLYFQKFFEDSGVALSFVKTNEDISYKQFTDTFVPNLSIIDVMMFCSPEQISDLLTQFSLVKGYYSPDDVPSEEN
jgi:hypothetical protein